MEVDEKLKWIAIGILFFLLASVTFWGLSAKRDWSKEQARNASLASQVSELKKERDQAKAALSGDGIPAISGFAQAFFVFDHLSDRYIKAKPWLTENGYKSLFPSGPPDEILKSSLPISGTVTDVEPYFHRVDEMRGTGMLVLKHHLKINNVVSTTITYVRLALIRSSDKQPYLIDRVEIVHQQKL